jgi:hypothetical protein
VNCTLVYQLKWRQGPTAEAGFIDAFQQLKPDGRIHFYRTTELEALFSRHGFEKELQVMSAITYPRELSPAYLELIRRTPASVLEGYRVTLGEKTVQITVDVINVRFRRRAA